MKNALKPASMFTSQAFDSKILEQKLILTIAERLKSEDYFPAELSDARSELGNGSGDDYIAGEVI